MTDRLKEDVIALATAKGRAVGTQGHKDAQAYLEQRLSSLRLEPYKGDTYRLSYGESFVNLIAQVPGEDSSLAPVLLGAHYDTAGSLPGADDNAAAVAIVLSAAESLQEEKPPRSVIIALFDAEEPPYFHSAQMGSTVFYEKQRQGQVHAAVILDLVGHDVALPGLENTLFITGAESNPQLPEVLRGAEPDDLKIIAALNRYVGDMSDHHIFRVNRRPYLFLSCGRWQHYHSPTDTPEKLNYEKMASISRYLVSLTHGLSRVGLGAPFERGDSLPYELETMRRHLGTLAAGFGLKLETRADVDRVAQALMSRFRL